MYLLIKAIKETATSVFFQAEHNELETFHTIEVQKDQIQNYLEYCGQNFIPAHQIGNIKDYDITLDICQDIVKFGKEHNDYFVVGGTASQPNWNPRHMFHLGIRYKNCPSLDFLPQRTQTA